MKERWLLEGDVGSHFFHSYVKGHLNHSAISHLEIDGELCLDSEKIASHICSFYKNFYVDIGSSGSSSLDINSIVPILVMT